MKDNVDEEKRNNTNIQQREKNNKDKDVSTSDISTLYLFGI